jgi:hypothetical protein
MPESKPTTLVVGALVASITIDTLIGHHHEPHLPEGSSFTAFHCPVYSVSSNSGGTAQQQAATIAGLARPFTR